MRLDYLTTQILGMQATVESYIFMITVANIQDTATHYWQSSTSDMSTDTVQPSPYGPGEQTETRMQHQKELGEILRGIKDDPTLNGILTMTKDGVLLSLTADREVSFKYILAYIAIHEFQVVDAVGLKSEHIKALLDRLPFKPENEVKYRGVDGTKVPRQQWFHPDKSELPPPYVPPPERRKENLTPEMLEKNRKLLEEKNKPREGSCNYLVSDHDLGLKEMYKKSAKNEKTA